MNVKAHEIRMDPFIALSHIMASLVLRTSVIFHCSFTAENCCWIWVNTAKIYGTCCLFRAKIRFNILKRRSFLVIRVLMLQELRWQTDAKRWETRQRNQRSMLPSPLSLWEPCEVSPPEESRDERKMRPFVPISWRMCQITCQRHEEKTCEKDKRERNRQTKMFCQVMWHKSYLGKQWNAARLFGKLYFFIGSYTL